MGAPHHDHDHDNHEVPAAFSKTSHVKPYTVLIIFFLGIGSAALGYSMSIIGTTLTQPSFAAEMKLATAPNANGLIGATNGLFYAGGCFGAISSGVCCNKFGRKKSTIIGATLILVGSALLTASVNMGMFITFRFFTGWGSLQLITTIPMWIAELVPPAKRGVLVDIHPVMVNLGYCAAAYCGIGFFYYKGGPDSSWRGPMGLSMVFPAILLAGIYWMPESPRYLLSKDRGDEAWTIIQRLHSDPGDPTNSFARREFYQIKKQMEMDLALTTWTSTLGSYTAIFKKASTRKRAYITMFLCFGQMSSGALVINNYGSLVYSRMGYDTAVTIQFQGGYQLTAWAMNAVAMLFVDRFPRNKLLSIGFFGSMFSLICEAVLQKFYLHSTNHSGLAACAAMVFVNTTFYCLFLEGPAYSYLAEVWPTYLRGQGYGLAMCVWSGTSIIWLQAAPTAFATLSWKFYIIFLVFNAIAGVVTWFYPDTLAKPLEEIAALFGDEDLVAVYQKDLENTDVMPDLVTGQGNSEKLTSVEHVEAQA